MTLSALLFDLDGTLVDSNGTHATAWGRALEDRGYRVGHDRIMQELGKGGDQLVPSLLGDEAEKRDGESLRHQHGSHFKQLAQKNGLKVAPAAMELLAELRRRGLRTALATSSKQRDIELIERASGVDLRSAFDVVANADDVEASKPEPDIVHAALQKLDLGAAQCALVGDTPWDALSASRAGVAALGVLFGGNDEATLRASGARLVLADVAAILAQLPEVLDELSPGVSRYEPAVIEGWMRLALNEAELARARGERAVGAVVLDGAGSLLGTGQHRSSETNDRLAHAELEALRTAARKSPDRSKDRILVTTVEPCVMCTAAAFEAAIDLVIFGSSDPDAGGARRIRPTAAQRPQRTPRVLGGVLEAQCQALLRA